MKKWKTLFLCLLLNCNIEKDQHQAPVKKTELQEINKIVYENFAALDCLRSISNVLNYKDVQDKKENLNFFCNCSTKNLKANEEEIFKILNQKFSEGRLKDQKNLLQHLPKECMDVNILEKYKIPESDNFNTVLYKVVEKFLEDNIQYFENLKNNLDDYKKNVESIEKLKNSVEAFKKLSDYLKAYSESYVKLNVKGQEFLIYLFFCNILPQYYNVYYENILRLKQNKNGEFLNNLSLVGAIQ